MKVLSQQFGSMNNNCYLIVDENTNKSALVDCPEYNQKMVDLIGDTQLEYILLTHGHFDHIIGAKEVKEKYGAKVLISKDDAPMLTSGKLSLAAFCGEPQNNVEADEYIKDNDIITVGDIEIKVIATPGHTKGGLCFMAEDSLFTGDTLFRLTCGRTDFPGGSPMEMQQSLYKLRDLEGDYKVYTGHDSFSTLDFERKNNPEMK